MITFNSYTKIRPHPNSSPSTEEAFEGKGISKVVFLREGERDFEFCVPPPAGRATPYCAAEIKHLFSHACSLMLISLHLNLSNNFLLLHGY